jgi:type IV secretion system protein VirB8
MFKKKAAPETLVLAGNQAEHFADAGDWEDSKVFLTERAEARAWRVAAGAAFLAILSMAVTVYTVKRDKPAAFLVTVDRATGETSTLRTLDADTQEYGEALAKHNAKRYVEACESYIYPMLQRDYDVCLTLSNDTVGTEYGKKFEGDKALDKVLGAHTEWRSTVISVRLPKDQPGKSVVSWQRIKRASGVESPVERFVSTLTYAYQPLVAVKESVWIENPTGYKVTAYRADPELIDARPAHSE